MNCKYRSDDFKDRNAFIIALIDGDGMIFTKDFLSKGEAGGKEAAVAFSNSMIGYASENLGHLESPKLIARIYANFTTLSETLVKTRLIDKASTFHEFVRGFNSSKLLFDFVDAGSKKHAAQQKISELMRLQLYDCHCHQVLLGCSQNNDHAHMLEDYRNDQELGDHISILESGPVHKDLADLDSNFKRTRFDGVFSTIQMVKAPVSAPLPKAPPALAAALPALTKVESNKTNSSASPANTPQMNWATVTAQAHATPTPTAKVNGTRVTTPSSSISSEPTKVKPYGKSIDTNRHGMRIDRVDTSIPNYEIQRVKKLKLCNIYYLQGVTLCTSGNCSHRHDYPISNYERKILREVARMTPCYYKTDCDDHECIYGHRCPQSKADSQGCYYGEDCRFFGWGHGIDTRVCKTVKV